MADYKTQKVERHFKKIVDNGNSPAGEDLIFDPNTGELVVQQRGEARSPDSVVADQVAEDGFFK